MRYIVDWVDNNVAHWRDFDSMLEAISFIGNKLSEKGNVLSLSHIKLKDGKETKEVGIYFCSEKTGISHTSLMELMSTGSTTINNKLFEITQNGIEVTKDKDFINRFPSLIDMFCYYSPVTTFYSYHKFNYSHDLSRLHDKAVYIDDDMIIAHSGEDNFKMLSYLEQRQEALHLSPLPQPEKDEKTILNINI